jgi:hypothetical protein
MTLHPRYALIVWRDDVPKIVSGGSNIESLEKYGSHLVQGGEMRDEAPAVIMEWTEAVNLYGDPRAE